MPRRVTMSTTVQVPREWRSTLRAIRRGASRQRLRWPDITLYAHRWLKHNGRDIWASADAKGLSRCVIHMREDDAQYEHTMLHEIAHAVTNLVVHPWRTASQDEHPPVFWAIHGMLYRELFR